MSLIRRLSSIFVVLLVSFLFVNGVSAATESEKISVNALKHLESVDSYAKYLIHENNPHAEKALKGFFELNSKEQEAFLSVLAEPELMSIGLNNGMVEVNGIDVPVTMDSEEVVDRIPVTTNNFGVLSSGTDTVTANETLVIFNVNVTTFYSSVTFKYNNSMATSIITSSHWHSSVNPATIISKVTENGQQYLTGGRAYHRGEWIMRSSVAPWVSDTVKLWVNSNGKEKRKQYSSTHPNIPGYSWRTF